MKNDKPKESIMNEIKGIYSSKLKILFAVTIIVAFAFLDKIIPPAGIPIAVALLFVLFWIRKIPIKNLGLFKPDNWGKTILIGIGGAIVIQSFGIIVLPHLLEFAGIQSDGIEGYKAIEGNNQMLLIYLTVSWTTAGFGEELIFRTFFIGQFSKLFKSEKTGIYFSLILSSVIFGFLHYDNGIKAIISTGITGFLFGLIYLNTHKNIWAIYIAHGTMNTVAFLIIYSGLYKVLM